MKSKFLAKSNGETIKAHTENLINNFKNLFRIYPDINVDKNLLLLACIYHDLGKMNLRFQKKLLGKIDKKEIPHAILSTAFINDDILIDFHGFSED